MASPTLSRVKRMYVGNMRVLTFMTVSGGTDDTQELPYHADSITAGRLFALTHTPLSNTGTLTRPRITSVTANRPTITYVGSASTTGQTFMRCWSR